MTEGAPLRRPPPSLAVVGFVVGVVFAGPLVYVVVRNLSLGSDVVSELATSATIEPLRRTVVLAVTVSASTAVVGTGLAWLVMRTDLPLRRLLRVLVALPLVFPSFVGALAFLNALAPGDLLDEFLVPAGADRLPQLSGWFGAWLVLTLFTYPYVYLPVAARLAALPPSLEESARLLGRRPAAVFRTVVLPQASGAVWAGTLLVFLYTLSDFGAVALMRYSTLTVEIFANRLYDQERAFALALVLGVLALVVVIGERSAARRRPVTEAAPSTRSLTVELGRWRWAAVGAVGLVLALGLVVPLAAMTYWAVRGLTGGSVEIGGDTAGDLLVPTINTSIIGIVAGLVAVTVVLPVAYLVGRYRSRVGDAANAFVVGGFALPGLVVALALVFWSLRTTALGSLYQTLPLLVFAYVVHFGAQSMRTAQVAVSGVPARLHDAARMLGAGRFRRFVTVDLPIMLPGLAAGVGLVLLSTMKELPATLLLRPTSFDTLAVRIWSAQEDGFLGEVGMASVVLVAASALLTWLLVVRRAERVL